MRRQSNWARPDQFWLTLRCTEVRYANSFIENGSIKFNTPESWAEKECVRGVGRGDKLEGTMALFNRDDIKHVKEFNQKYEKLIGTELIRINEGERIYLKNKRSMNLPCYCFYIMKNSLFECPEKEGDCSLQSNIAKTYFRDFTDNLSSEDVEKLDDMDKPAVIIIERYSEFVNRIKKALFKIGVKEEEIIISRVDYHDFKLKDKNAWIDFRQRVPYELLFKDNRFEDQSEARIIINTNNEKIKEYLKNNTINIGPTDDIATIKKGYFYEGLKVKINGYSKKI